MLATADGDGGVAANGALAPRATYGLWDVAQQGGKVLLVLTVHWIRRMRGEVERRRTGGARAELGEVVLQGYSWPDVPPERSVWAL